MTQILITFNVLEEKKACVGGIKYFKSLEKQEWELMELIKRCIEDDERLYCSWLVGKFSEYLTKKQKVEIFEMYAKNGRGFCSIIEHICDILTKKQKIEISELYIKKGFAFGLIIEYIHDALTKKQKVEIFEMYAKNGRNLYHITEYICDALTKEQLKLIK